MRNFFLILVGVLLWSCDDDDYPYAEVPSVILNEFWAQYPDAKDAEFTISREDHEVEFELYGNDYSAIIGASGNIVKEKKEITWKDLPLEVQQKLQEKYGQKKIKDIEWVKSTEGRFYQVKVNHFFNDEKIVLNAAGEIEMDRNYWK